MRDKKKRGIIWKSFFMIFGFIMFGALLGGLAVIDSRFTFASFEEYHQMTVVIEILSRLDNNEEEEAKSYVIEYLENQYELHSDPNMGYFFSKMMQEPLVPIYIERAAETNSDLDARLKKNKRRFRYQKL